MQQDLMMKMVEVSAQNLEGAADVMDSVQLLLSRLSQRCNGVAYRLDMDDEKSPENVSEAIETLYEMSKSFVFIVQTTEKWAIHLQNLAKGHCNANTNSSPQEVQAQEIDGNPSIDLLEVPYALLHKAFHRYLAEDTKNVCTLQQDRLPLDFMIGAEKVEVECLLKKLVLTTGILNQHLTLAAHTDDPEPLSRMELEAINHELSDVLWKLKAGVHGVEKARTLQ